MNRNRIKVTFSLIILTILLLGGVITGLRSVDLLSASVAGGPWYVNATTGNDSNACLSAGSACATVGGALGKADPGDTVHIAAGTYDEAITIEQPVTLMGAGAEQTILTNSSGDVFTIEDGDANATLFPVLVQDVAIQDASGQGVYSAEATTLHNVIIQSNGDRAIYNIGHITVTNSSVTNHHMGSGGALIVNYGAARMNLSEVTVHDNSGDSSFVHAQNNVHMSLSNVTISDNSGDGEGLVVAGSAVVTVTNSTIANNAEGLVQYSNQLRMQNTVVAGNGVNCWSEVISLGNNLEDDDSCGFDQGSDSVNTDAQLSALANNGGAVPTHNPASSSPLIDTGRNDVCPAVDARGAIRPFDGDDNGSILCDIGAVEYSAVGVVSVTIDAPANGNINTDITISADVLPDTATPPITYTWTADGQSPVVHSSGNSDSVTFNWNRSGLKTINVTADNGLAQSSDNVQINIQTGVQPLTAVTISGPNSGAADDDVTFTANATPANATQPLTYTWVIEGQSTIVHSGGLSDSITVSWPEDGSYNLTVTADNGVNSVQDSHTFTAVSWYVNGSSGDDSNNCLSATNACATIQAALDKAAAAGVIHIAAGTYDEALAVEQGAKLYGAGTAQTILTNSSGVAVTISDFVNNPSYQVEVHDLTVANAQQEGIYNNDDLTLSNVIIENNGLRGLGNDGTLLMRDSLIRGNTDSSGAALFNTGQATLEAVTISGNNGDNTVVHTQSGGSTSLLNVTISGNPSGTAVLSTAGSVVEILNSTIVNNADGGMANYATITVQNSIIAGNGSDNCITTITSLGHNIEDSDSCNLAQAGDQVNSDPQLSPLGGSPLPVHQLLENSPAIDAGDNAACPATDQLGTARPVDGDDDETAVCDIGAIERIGTYFTFLPIIIR